MKLLDIVILKLKLIRKVNFTNEYHTINVSDPSENKHGKDFSTNEHELINSFHN